MASRVNATMAMERIAALESSLVQELAMRDDRIKALEAQLASLQPKRKGPHPDDVKRVIKGLETLTVEVIDDEDRVKRVFAKATALGVNIKNLGWTFSTRLRRFVKRSDRERLERELEARLAAEASKPSAAAKAGVIDDDDDCPF